MIKTLTNLFKQDKEKFVVPKGVQDVIPVAAIFDDGIFKVGKDKYSKTYRFTDINYAVASREDKEAMFLEYSELLNSLDSGATTKITINNRRLNRLDFEQTILIPTTGDNLDEYREEYNKMLLDKATGANSIVQDKYITISINKKSVEDARTYFARVGADLIAHFGRLGSKCVELETDERLRIFHDFYRVGEESSFHFDIKETRKKGHDFKDYICPDTMEFEKDYFKMGNRYGRVLFLREYASYIKDSMVAELTDMNRNLMMSIDIVPVPTDEAVKEAENRLLGVETNITNWQRRQNANNNFSATVPYDMEQQKKEMKEFLDDLTTRDQRMMFAVITMVITADSKEQLENDTEALLTTARKHLCQFATLRFQQVDGLNTVMPFGTRKIDAFRTLTTESLSVFIPFRVQDIFHENGIYYGQNVISKNMIIADRKQLLNGNSFILGVSGGGKSFAAKGEIINQVLSSDADIIIIDPEREYSQLVNAMGGEVINISATSDNHINAMDMNKDYGDGANPVILKSEFIMSLCEQLIGGTNLGAKQKSIIDRCTASVYRSYQQNDYQGHIPTLQDFRAELLQQDEPEAKELALAIELFTHGSLNTFAKQTNVDTNNRLICYDILDLGKQLMPIGTAKATVATVKAIIAGTKALVAAIAAGGWIAVLIIMIVVLFGAAVAMFGGGSDSNSYTPVSAEVEAYEPIIQKYAKEYGIPEYVELIKAVMMQESGGRGLDPMQAAEGSFNTRYPHEPNGIKDPEYSIQCGVQELKAALTSAEVESPIDMEHIKLALQGYNFGNGYISWAKTKYGGYSYANAVEFSTQQAQRLGWDSYGDTQYPAHVLRYYPYGRAFTVGGNQAIVEVALTQLGNQGGQPYWSWYGFNSRVEWCACFVSWCADQCGYIESGLVPKFAGCVDGANWFKSNGKWQDRTYEPKVGDIIFFDWEGDGTTDHVGIVEKCENGTVYTVEGNSGDACKQRQYAVGSSNIYGYGIPAY